MFRLTSLNKQKENKEKRLRAQSDYSDKSTPTPRTPKDNTSDGENHFDYIRRTPSVVSAI